MVISIIIAVSVAGAFVSGFFCAIKAVQLGLKWQIQAADKEMPTTPAQDAKAAAETVVGMQSAADIVSEWVNGKQIKGDE